jgi:hypothetical protein
VFKPRKKFRGFFVLCALPNLQPEFQEGRYSQLIAADPLAVRERQGGWPFFQRWTTQAQPLTKMIGNERFKMGMGVHIRQFALIRPV